MNIQHHKDQLLTLKAEYEQRINKLSDHLQHPQDEMNQHWDDQAVKFTENDMRKKLLVEAEQGLALVNSALRRMEQGDYGICDECGEEISENRLQAVPYARECITHAK
ncbi:TraR/DksA C4-type zinc finger protein [Moraxella nasovis]|uniref:TraR/DksA family transcriptional regulator n=1 Tax=Moraxella nasovis TaxID=2904121 RepID=UPI001F614727|nr:TraR/DksA C4-type zinc finger protein [Moraxella nasovis]UNU73508.1 TraR/DksA C4-type zinc finger protein [Moraxella nasovis]